MFSSPGNICSRPSVIPLSLVGSKGFPTLMIVLPSMLGSIIMHNPHNHQPTGALNIVHLCSFERLLEAATMQELSCSALHFLTQGGSSTNVLAPRRPRIKVADPGRFFRSAATKCAEILLGYISSADSNLRRTNYDYV